MLKYTCLILAACFLSCLGTATAPATSAVEPITRDVTCDATSCLRIVLDVDKDAQRLDNFGNVATLPSNHRAQSPQFKKIAAHYYELLPNAATQVRGGAFLYQVKDTSAGGSAARDFQSINVVTPGDEAFAMDLSQVPAGTYEYLRVSVSYQKYEVDFEKTSFPSVSGGTAVIASFLANQLYIEDFKVGGQTVTVNGNRSQGFWAFYSDEFPTISGVNPLTGQAPSGATTVVNPIASTSPIARELNSCIVTGEFTEPLVITGDEATDVNLRVVFSTNQSFEWQSTDSNDDWNFNSTYVPEAVVDMGVRGMTVNVEE